MQRKHLGQAMRYLVAVCVLISTFAILACGGDDDEVEIINVNATVEADDDTVPAVQGRPFTIANGQVFGGNIGNLPIIFTFTTPREFTATRAATGLSLSGTVSYGSDDSCTFTVTTGGQGALSVSNCNLLVNANNVVVGTGQVSGTIALVLRNNAGITITSDPLPATVFINGDGELFVVNPVTGVSVNMDVEP
jgi:Flp pilus assembly protein TadG